jgi:hypothetical protein
MAALISRPDAALYVLLHVAHLDLILRTTGAASIAGVSQCSVRNSGHILFCEMVFIESNSAFSFHQNKRKRKMTMNNQEQHHGRSYARKLVTA